MDRLKLTFLSGIFLTLMNFSNAQLGINAYYQDNDYKTWNEVINSQGFNDNHAIFKTNLKFGIDFGFDMAMYRVSFYPEISYAWSDFSFTAAADQRNYDLKLIQYAFNFKTHVYPLDLLSKKSSQCPSFYRGMDKFTKGWYLLVFPELSYSDKKGQFTNAEEEDITNFDDPGFSFKFGIGTGIDIGINSSISVSPNIMYVFAVGEKWEGFSQNGFGQPSFNDGTEVGTLSLGLRIGFWF